MKKRAYASGGRSTWKRAILFFAWSMTCHCVLGCGGAAAEVIFQSPSENPDYLYLKETALGPYLLMHLESIQILKRVAGSDVAALQDSMKEYAALPPEAGALNAIIEETQSAIAQGEFDVRRIAVALELANSKTALGNNHHLESLALEFIGSASREDITEGHVRALSAALLYLAACPEKGQELVAASCDPKFWLAKGYASSWQSSATISLRLASYAVWHLVEKSEVARANQVLAELENEFVVRPAAENTELLSKERPAAINRYLSILSMGKKNLERRRTGETLQWWPEEVSGADF